jgi:MFS family permease
VRTGWQAVLVFGLVIGLGQGFGGPIPVQTGVTLWFKRRRALALSLTIMSAGVGGFVAAPSLNKLVASLGGDWRKGWLVIAVLAALSTLSTLLFVRDRPSDLGQEPDGGDAPAANAMNHGGVGVKPPRVHKETGDWTMAQVLRTPVFWIIMFGAVASTAGYSLLLAHGVIHFKGLGLSAEAAAMSLGLLTLCSIIGKMIFGALGDRIEPRFIWSASLLIFVAGVLLAVKATTPAQVYAYALLAGAGFGAGFLAFMTLLGNYYGPKAYASVLGVTILIIAVANSIGPFVAGLAYDHLGSYALALQISGGIALVGAIGVLFALPPKRVHR